MHMYNTCPKKKGKTNCFLILILYFISLSFFLSCVCMHVYICTCVCEYEYVYVSACTLMCAACTQGNQKRAWVSSSTTFYHIF